MGVMGAPMARHLLRAGHALKVFTRTASKADPLCECGATWAQSPAEAADGTDVTFSIVGMPEDVEQVHLGEDGTLSAEARPAMIVDMTTSRPSLARRIASVAEEHGVRSLDAPVSGGDVGARGGTLSIMVGGDQEAFTIAEPLFDVLGGTVVWHGEAGAGQHCKMVNQILVAASMVGAVEALRYADAAGLDGHRVLESVSAGAAGSWTISNLAPRILRGDFAPGFFVNHFVKDLRIAIEEASVMGLQLPGLELASVAYERLAELGYGDRGTHALALLSE